MKRVPVIGFRINAEDYPADPDFVVYIGESPIERRIKAHIGKLLAKRIDQEFMADERER